MEEMELLYKIKRAIFDTYKILGPGLLEKVYEEVLCYCLEEQGLKAQRQVYVPIKVKGNILKAKLFIDVLVNREVVLELKSARTLTDVNKSQLLSYLRLTGLRRGFLINFCTTDLNSSIISIINGYDRTRLDDNGVAYKVK